MISVSTVLVDNLSFFESLLVIPLKIVKGHKVSKAKKSCYHNELPLVSTSNIDVMGSYSKCRSKVRSC